MNNELVEYPKYYEFLEELRNLLKDKKLFSKEIQKVYYSL